MYPMYKIKLHDPLARLSSPCDSMHSAVSLFLSRTLIALSQLSVCISICLLHFLSLFLSRARSVAEDPSLIQLFPRRIVQKCRTRVRSSRIARNESSSVKSTGQIGIFAASFSMSIIEIATVFVRSHSDLRILGSILVSAQGRFTDESFLRTRRVNE